MSTWTSKAAALLASLALAACQVEGGFGTSRSVPVLDGALNVGVPAGYCVDRGASREGNGAAVVIMGRCSSEATVPPAVVTVSVGRAGSAGVTAAGGAAMAAWFTSAEGRKALSRDGRASDVRVHQAISSGDALLLHVTDRRVGTYWRAITGKKGRLITLSATGTPRVPLDPAAGRRVIDQLLAALSRANAG